MIGDISRNQLAGGTVIPFWTVDNGQHGGIKFPVNNNKTGTGNDVPLGTFLGVWTDNGYFGTGTNTPDPTMYIGYNQDATGQRLDTAKSGWSMGLEGNYDEDNNAAITKSEWYLQHIAITGTGGIKTSRPIMFKQNNSTGLVEGGYVAAPVFTIYTQPPLLTTVSKATATFENALVTIKSQASLDTTLAVEGNVTGTTAGILKLGYGATLDYFHLQPGANCGIVQVNGTEIMRLFSTPNGGAGKAIGIGTTDNSATIRSKGSAADLIGFKYSQFNASPTVDAFELCNSSDVAQWSVDKNFINVQAVTSQAVGAGTTQGSTPLTKGLNNITGANSSKAVTLPTAVAGMHVKIINNTAAQTLPVFPASGAKINGGSTDASAALAAMTCLEYVAVSTTEWFTH